VAKHMVGPQRPTQHTTCICAGHNRFGNMRCCLLVVARASDCPALPSAGYKVVHTRSKSTMTTFRTRASPPRYRSFRVFLFLCASINFHLQSDMYRLQSHVDPWRNHPCCRTCLSKGKHGYCLVSLNHSNSAEKFFGEDVTVDPLPPPNSRHLHESCLSVEIDMPTLRRCFRSHYDTLRSDSSDEWSD
jgi:hypothetical protein